MPLAISFGIVNAEVAAIGQDYETLAAIKKGTYQPERGDPLTAQQLQELQKTLHARFIENQKRATTDIGIFCIRSQKMKKGTPLQTFCPKNKLAATLQ